MLASRSHSAYFLAISSPFSIIGTAWDFARKQPALKGVGVWFFLIPGTGMNVLSTVMDWNEETGFMGFTETQQDMFTLMVIIAILLLAVMMLWGGACVLLVGKKLVHSRAGRNRTSLVAVAREGRSFIIPLLLTEILRLCFTLLWGILFIIPGILYSLRTVFYDIVVVTEEISYRSALKRSKEIVRGHLWSMLWRLAVIVIVIYGPPNLLALLGYWAAGAYDAGMLTMDVIDAVLNAPATIIAILSTVVLYDELKSRNA